MNMKRGLTLIELLVVIAILGLLMAVLVVAMSGSTESARAANCLTNMRNLAMGCQSYGMRAGTYPFAGSFEQYAARGKRSETTFAEGWIGFDSSHKYTSCYSKGYSEDAYYCVTNGTIWSAVAKNHSTYICPTHARAAREAGGLSVWWSYAMNAYFLWQSRSTPYSSGRCGRDYGGMQRADRVLLFSEIQFEQIKGLSDNVKLDESASTATDPILQYDGSDGASSPETIGFNHLMGKQHCAHVCFADAHTEKFLLPRKSFNANNLKTMTKWLCNGGQDDTGKTGDVILKGSQYELLK